MSSTPTDRSNPTRAAGRGVGRRPAFVVAAVALVFACVAAALWFSPLRQRWAPLPLRDAAADATPGATPASTLPDSANSAAAAPRTRLQVRGEVVERGDFVVTVQGTGRIEAIQRAELSSRVGERVMQVLVREGDVVKRGQPLIELDPAPFDLSWREAQARQQAAKLDFDAALFADTNPSEERRARIAHRTRLTVAEQQLARAQLDRDAATLRAPFDGEVVSVTAAVGERIPAERPLVTLVDRHRVLLAAEVLETDFASLRKGAVATVTLPAFPSAKFEGRVSALEISSMELALQAKLLRVLQDRIVERVGGQRANSVDLRVIAAANRDLPELVRAGKFREDLFHRLNVHEVHLPPLRDRDEDIVLLAHLFRDRAALRLGTPPPALTPELVAFLRGYAFPGNVREREHMMEKMVVLSEGETLGVEDLPPSVWRQMRGTGSNSLTAGGGLSASTSVERADRVGAPQPEDLLLSGPIDFFEIEERLIREALRRANGNISAAARQLGMSYKTPRYRVGKFGV